ncbi:hypothetical protein Y1Q_0002847 [Alligator mississippiensis]|uniref:Uncharacterized protein n=1 Tax=Alligator mississippiensis TaxID=8496 RepID=A0A151NZQ6_ALLMI|nr:hypothetical protein Y1Q_0002847 [Alligator mississippiensis]
MSVSLCYLRNRHRLFIGSAIQSHCLDKAVEGKWGLCRKIDDDHFNRSEDKRRNVVRKERTRVWIPECSR